MLRKAERKMRLGGGGRPLLFSVPLPGTDHVGDDDCPICRLLRGRPALASADGYEVHELDETLAAALMGG